MVSISGDSITVMVRVRLANQPPLQYHSWIANLLLSLTKQHTCMCGYFQSVTYKLGLGFSLQDMARFLG